MDLSDPANASPARTEAGGRILVVDDQRTNAELMAGLLRQRAYEVHTALDGEEALRLVHAVRPGSPASSTRIARPLPLSTMRLRTIRL